MSLQPLVKENPNVKAVFVGGKGGVGKTSCACAVAIQFALHHPQKKVLLISTDPAHNVSDAFVQQFSGKPGPVNGMKNLFACEVDPQAAMQEEIDRFKIPKGEDDTSEEGGISEFQNFFTNLPGIDEAMALSSVLNFIDFEDNEPENSFDIIVFDTAPTGHTLRLLQLPALLKVGLQNLTSWKNKFATIFSSFTSMVFANESKKLQVERTQLLEKRMQVWLEAVTKLTAMFKNKESTQFLCVCNASFLSVYETKRLINELKIAEIHCEYVIVNMLMSMNLAKISNEKTVNNIQSILANSNVNSKTVETITDAVMLCGGISKMQNHYLKLLEDEKELELILLPLLPGEIRGVKDLTAFSKKLITQDPKMQKGQDFEDAWEEQATDYVADTKAKLMSKTLLQEDKKEEPQAESTQGQGLAITPEMISLAQGLIMKPGGIQELLSSEIVTTERKKPENADLNEFLNDIQTNGLMAGFKYLSNASVMSKLAEIAKQLS